MVLKTCLDMRFFLTEVDKLYQIYIQTYQVITILQFFQTAWQFFLSKFGKKMNKAKKSIDSEHWRFTVWNILSIDRNLYSFNRTYALS